MNDKDKQEILKFINSIKTIAQLKHLEKTLKTIELLRFANPEKMKEHFEERMRITLEAIDKKEKELLNETKTFKQELEELQVEVAARDSKWVLEHASNISKLPKEKDQKTFWKQFKEMVKINQWDEADQMLEDLIEDVE